MSEHAPWILSLNSEQTDLQNAGGKGANLARLVRVGFPVPDGFILSTSAYQTFVESNQLLGTILAHFTSNDPTSMNALEAISHEIRQLFTQAALPGELADAIRQQYRGLGAGAVAVRSSATAEDLPELSFAGQQDTYLNVVGEESLLQAVVNCWGSLWTARAIGYRLRNQVPQEDLSLGVVVQRMVESQASGVLFSANPVSGLRSEVVIDAVLGLGEALVSGRVEPDHYVIDTANRRILSKSIGRKAVSLHGQADGGTLERREDRSSVQALPDEQILTLAGLGKQVENQYGIPQDIEWACEGDVLYLLQTRPITALFPIPDHTSAEPLTMMVSFASIQGIMEPITPIGQDTLCWIAATVGRVLDRDTTRANQKTFLLAGERIWINFSGLLRNKIGRKILPAIFSQIEPTVRQALEVLWDDPGLQPGRHSVRLISLFRLARFFGPLVFNVFLNLASPQKRRQMIVGKGEDLLGQIDQDFERVQGSPGDKLAERVGIFLRTLSDHLPGTFLLFVSGVASGMASWNLMRKITAHKALEEDETARRINNLILQATRGMPHNPTTEMDLALWDTARVIQKDPVSLTEFERNNARILAQRFLDGDLPETIMHAVDRFLEGYGGRGLGEIDLGRARWREDPAPVFEMLSSFLEISDETQAPDVVFERGAFSAENAIHELAAIVKSQPLGGIKARLMRIFARRTRQLMGMRESPKFFAVRLMASLQRELLRSGQEFTAMGELQQPDDLVFLTFNEIQAFAAGKKHDWRMLIQSRRSVYQREKNRCQIPRVLLSDGRAFYEGISNAGADANILNGSPVSPGSVTGRVRVVLDPRQANLQPGEILVCPGTDPSWTPLFLSAGGLVMETGGMMTHGAVVAREYGIPAIVGVDRATRRLHTGERIKMDGSTGQIVLEVDQNKVDKYLNGEIKSDLAAP